MHNTCQGGVIEMTEEDDVQGQIQGELRGLQSPLCIVKNARNAL